MLSDCCFKSISILLFILIAVLSGCCDHVWTDATCLEPRVCSECGRTEGDPLGHDTPELSCTSSDSCLRCGAWVSATGHEIIEASCIEPEKCRNCDEIFRDALGHFWKDETCTHPKTCSRCHETEGEALGHDWAEAPEGKPRVCNVCAEVEDLRLEIPKSSAGYRQENYLEVIHELETLGFSNIQIGEIQYDVGTGFLDSGEKEISMISVDGNSEFSAGDRFEKDVLILIEYRDLRIYDPSIEYTKVTADTLINELDSNAMRAKETYTNAYVEITGRLGNISSNGSGFDLYPMYNSWEFRSIDCDVLTDEQKTKLMDLSSDTIITIKGKITYVNEYGYDFEIYGFS